MKLYTDILSVLKEDSRFSLLTIAKMVGSDEKTVENAICDMEKKGIIVKYTAVTNGAKIDNNLVEAFIEVRVTPQKDMGFDAIAKNIALCPEVKNLYLMSGAYDLAVTVEGKTLRDVSNFVHEKLAIMDNVTSTSTHFILKCYKIEGVLLEGSLTENRIPQA